VELDLFNTILPLLHSDLLLNVQVGWYLTVKQNQFHSKRYSNSQSTTITTRYVIEINASC